MNLEEQFEELYQKWKDETCVLSSTAAMKDNENYKKLYDLGPEIVPLIIEKLRNNEGHFLVMLVDEFYPGLITVTGYVNIKDYCDGIVALYDIVKAANSEEELRESLKSFKIDGRRNHIE